MFGVVLSKEQNWKKTWKFQISWKFLEQSQELIRSCHGNLKLLFITLPDSRSWRLCSLWPSWGPSGDIDAKNCTFSWRHKPRFSALYLPNYSWSLSEEKHLILRLNEHRKYCIIGKMFRLPVTYIGSESHLPCKTWPSWHGWGDWWCDSTVQHHLSHNKPRFLWKSCDCEDNGSQIGYILHRTEQHVEQQHWKNQCISSVLLCVVEDASLQTFLWQACGTPGVGMWNFRWILNALLSERMKRRHRYWQVVAPKIQWHPWTFLNGGREGKTSIKHLVSTLLKTGTCTWLKCETVAEQLICIRDFTQNGHEAQRAVGSLV